MQEIACQLIRFFVLAMFIWIVLGWVVAFGRLPWGHPVRKIYDLLARVFEPILRPIRSVIPPVRFGGAGLDLSPLVLIIGVIIVQRLIC